MTTRALARWRRILCRTALIAIPALGVALPENASAQGWLADRRRQDGEGLKTGDFEFHPGIEYWIERRVALRAGMEARNFSAGGGIRVRRFGMDYAYRVHRDLDSSHRVSLSYAF